MLYTITENLLTSRREHCQRALRLLPEAPYRREEKQAGINQLTAIWFEA